MSNDNFPVIAGVEIITDAEGRFNLNCLHRASGLGDSKKPSEWLRTKQAKELIEELSGNSHLGQALISTAKGGINPGTFAHELLAISYAGWISAKFQLQVNQVFVDYKEGRIVQPVAIPIHNYALATKTHIAEVASRMLRMSGTSTIRMLGKICEEEGVSSAFLPNYTDEQLTRALGDLLKEHGSELSAIAANKRLIEMGYLEELSRRSSKKGEKKFKSITDKGLKYGKNETSKQNPNETQPRYFVDTFPELLDIINSYKRGNLTLVEENKDL